MNSIVRYKQLEKILQLDDKGQIRTNFLLRLTDRSVPKQKNQVQLLKKTIYSCFMFNKRLDTNYIRVTHIIKNIFCIKWYIKIERIEKIASNHNQANIVFEKYNNLFKFKMNKKTIDFRKKEHLESLQIKY